MTENKPPRRVCMSPPIDWDDAFEWLKDGYTTGDIALMYGISMDKMCRRAKAELSEETHRLWKALNQKSRLRIRWEGHERAECGSDAGYMRHYREKQLPPCQPCKDAHAQACKKRRNDRLGRANV